MIYIYITYIQGGPKKKSPVLFFIPKLCFTFFPHILQVV